MLDSAEAWRPILVMLLKEEEWYKLRGRGQTKVMIYFMLQREILRDEPERELKWSRMMLPERERVHCDASAYHRGWLLSDTARVPEEFPVPIAFASQKFNATEELEQASRRGLGSVIRVE
ncbi:hypothetical protein TNCV_1793731 [Trichonephila clavipes]|nr:hypothetical protein TNCV_1793731 [Trichonephila clavipes]